MATEVKSTVAQAIPESKDYFNLDKIISKPTWKEILFELIATKRLDPWNVDIVAIADGFLKKIKEMEKVELLVPANIILAASILLRYKSDYIKFEPPQPEVLLVSEEDRTFEEMPLLELSNRIPPKRQITLEELIGEMERVITYDTTERIIKPRGAIDQIINITIKDFDIDKKMDEVLTKLKETTDSEGWTLFSRILTKQERLEMIYCLLSVLHLVQKERVDIKQDELFGDIFIRVIDTVKKEEREN